MPLDPRLLKITLVPGTWAYGMFARGVTRYQRGNPPRWFEPGSPFRTKLAIALDGHGIPYEIEVHQWDGANSVLSRAKEADYLKSKLANAQKEGVRRVVIAHSHGGNIACKAASRLVPPADDLAIVTLATPFLQAAEREEESPKIVMVILFVIVGLLAFGAFGFSSGQVDGLPALKNLALGLLLVIPLFVARVWFAKYDEANLAAAMNYGPMVNGRMLVVRGFSDEATATIVLGSIGTGLTNGILYLLATPLRWFWANRWTPYLFLVLYVAVLTAFMYYAVRIFQVISVWNTLGLFVALLALPVLVAGGFSSLYGREMFFQCLNLVLTVDSVPDTRCNADIVTLRSTQLSMAGLRHGIYNQPRCASVVADWLATGKA